MKLLFKKPQLNIVIIYLVIGGLWILFSDIAIAKFTDNPDVITMLQTYKGWFYVLITGLLLYFLIHRSMQKRDIIHKQLSAAKETAEKADMVKSAFLSNMSHEIRTPMNAIIGFSELIKESNLSSLKREEYIEYIQESSQQLVNLITNISDASELKVNQAHINMTDFFLNDLMDKLFLETSAEIPAQKLNRIELNLTKELSRPDSAVRSDYGKLYRILYHLVTNAIKFTPSGKIEIGYENLGDYQFRFFVRDTGIGISDSEHQTVFQSFVKSGEEKDEIRGAGLGLSIVKGYTDLLNGNIHMSSKPEKGTSFLVTIPVEAPLITS